MIYFILIIKLQHSVFLYFYKKINIYDYPSENKIHTKVPLLGGLIFQ